MLLLIIGLVLFIGPHLALFQTSIMEWKRRMSEQRFKGLFSIITLIGFVSLIVGFGEARSSALGSTILYHSPHWLQGFGMLLGVIGIIFFCASKTGGYIHQYIKHPQMVGLKIWAFGHLLINGDLASIVLFIPLFAWGLIATIIYKKRSIDSGVIAPAPKGDIIAITVGLVVSALFIGFLHTWLIGKPVIPR